VQPELSLGGKLKRKRRLTLIAGIVLSLSLIPFLPASAQAAGPRVTLRVLVLSDGGPAVEAIASQLTSEGVPFTKVDLNASNRPVINAAYLQQTASGVVTAKFQGIVLPNENPFGSTTSAEMAALVAYEKQFAVRQVDAYTWANPAVGLNYAGYLGSLDGVTATVTAAGKAREFKYLDGPDRFEDNDPAISESYGYVATPLPDDPLTVSHFEPLVTAPMTDGTAGSIVGEYTHDGRTELVITFVYNANQNQYKTLASGIVTWVTKGVHLGYDRNYFSLHVDDVFATGGRWSVDSNCTPGDGCPIDSAGNSIVTTPPIRMAAADVQFMSDWQKQTGFKLDLYFNGGGSDEYIADSGPDTLLTAFQAKKTEFRWANHTYTHDFLGCLQDFTVIPWKCQTNPNGTIKYQTKAFIKAQITKNVTWAAQKGFAIDKSEIVTGEHSGFLILPQQPADNPSLAAAFNETSIKWAGSDASRGLASRTLGSAVTVPRYPINIFFNTATKAEEVDEYNWIYTSRANGGSGICEDNPATTTCIAPLTSADAFDTYIAPLQSQIVLSHILNNDPRPHYVHQSNWTEGRIIVPVLDSILTRYNDAFAANTPLVNLAMKDDSTELSRMTAWRSLVAAGSVSGYVQDGKVTATAGANVQVPITAPEGTKTMNLAGAIGGLFGAQYAGERSGWTATSSLLRNVWVKLPA
jgi:hypothetical protein